MKNVLLPILLLAACEGAPEVHEAPQTADAPPAPVLEEVDAYFQETDVRTSTAGPEVITRNLIQDGSGDYWLASWHGFLRYDGETFTNVTLTEDLRRFRGFSVLEDRAGNVWLGSLGAGVYRYDGESFTNFTTRDGMGNDTVLAIFEDRDGNVWFGGHGLTKYDGETFTSFDESDGFTSQDVHAIDQSPDGDLWLGTRGALFRFDGERFTDFTAELGVAIQENSYTPALIDQRGDLWFSGTCGLYRYADDRLHHMYALPTFALFEDSKGGIWFNGATYDGEEITWGSVLNRYDPSAEVEGPLHQVRVPRGMIFGFLEDRNGQIWFGTGNGICRIDGDSVETY